MVRLSQARTHELTESLEQTKEALQAQAAEADAAREEAQSLREQQERTHADVEHRANMAIAEEREKALDAQRRQQTRLETDHRERMEKQEAEANVAREQLAAVPEVDREVVAGVLEGLPKDASLETSWRFEPAADGLWLVVELMDLSSSDAAISFKRSQLFTPAGLGHCPQEANDDP